MKVLSIRQPWAWAIVYAGKDIENRTWYTNYRGEFLIHASKGCLINEYDLACDFIEKACGLSVPSLGSLQKGGIIGKSTVVDCVEQHSSPWFEGEYGLVLQDTSEISFIECKGKNTRFFEYVPLI